MQVEYDSIDKEKSKTATELAYAEVIHYNKKNLEKELQNESRQHNRQQSRSKQREEYGYATRIHLAYGKKCIMKTSMLPPMKKTCYKFGIFKGLRTF